MTLSANFIFLVYFLLLISCHALICHALMISDQLSYRRSAFILHKILQHCLPPQHGQSQRVLTPSFGMSFLESAFHQNIYTD